MEIEGLVLAIMPPTNGISRSGKEWYKQEFVLETREQYPKKVVFSRMNKEKIDKYPISQGQAVKVSFDIDAREFNGKLYNSLTAWKVEGIEGDVAIQQETVAIPKQEVRPQRPPTQQPQQTTFIQEAQVEQDSSDDLPF